MTPTPSEALSLFIRLALTAVILLGSAWLLEVCPPLGIALFVLLFAAGLFAGVLSDQWSRPPRPRDDDKGR